MYFRIFCLSLGGMTSLVAQTVKCLSTTRETQVRSLGQEDPLEKEMAIHSNILAWESPWIEEPGGYSPWGLKESDMTERLTLSLNVSSNLLRIPSFTPPYSFCSVSSKWLCCDEVPFSGSLRLWVSQIYLNVWPSFFSPQVKKRENEKRKKSEGEENL